MSGMVIVWKKKNKSVCIGKWEKVLSTKGKCQKNYNKYSSLPTLVYIMRQIFSHHIRLYCGTEGVFVKLICGLFIIYARKQRDWFILVYLYYYKRIEKVANNFHL